MGQSVPASCPELVSVENDADFGFRMIIELFHRLEISRTFLSTTMHGDVRCAFRSRACQASWCAGSGCALSGCFDLIERGCARRDEIIRAKFNFPSFQAFHSPDNFV